METNKINLPLMGKSYEKLKVLVKEINVQVNTKSGIELSGNFCYLNFRDGMHTQDDFVKYVSEQIMYYCIDRRKIIEAQKKYEETNDVSIFAELYQKARELFINAAKQNTKTGEPGEIILYIFLEALLTAPQLVSKMELKTNCNMPVHGSDGIHMRFEYETGTLFLYYGEAKLYKALNDAIDEIVQSVANFRDKGASKSASDFEVDVIKRHADFGFDEQSKQAFMDYLDPYNTKKQNVKEVHACLAVWDAEIYNLIDQGVPRENVENLFRERYTEIIQKASDRFLDGIIKKSLKQFRFHLFLLPVNCVKDFRHSFCNKIGLEYVDTSSPGEVIND